MRRFYRTARGGHVPLDALQRAQLLELYDEHDVPVVEIAAIFGISSGTAYRWLDRLGLKPQSEMTPAEAADRARRRAEDFDHEGNVVPIKRRPA